MVRWNWRQGVEGWKKERKEESPRPYYYFSSFSRYCCLSEWVCVYFVVCVCVCEYTFLLLFSDSLSLSFLCSMLLFAFMFIPPKYIYKKTRKREREGRREGGRDEKWATSHRLPFPSPPWLLHKIYIYSLVSAFFSFLLVFLICWWWYDI